MIKQICILTKSYKHGGYCVAGIDMENRQWVRLVSSDDPNEDEIRKEFMFVDLRPIKCLDVIEFDFKKHIPRFCQIENWLINKSYKPQYIKTLSIRELVDIITIDKCENFIFNKEEYLLKAEAKEENRSLYIFNVKNLKIDVTEYEKSVEVKYKYKCSFEYNGYLYSNISLTDPLYRVPTYDGLKVNNALIVASLPRIPHFDGFYYKFVAKIIPINEEDLYRSKNENETREEIKGENNSSILPFVSKDIVVQTNQTPGIVSFENYDQLKERIESGVEYYSKFEYTLSNYKLAIQHRDELKYVKSVLEKTKRNIVRIYNEPLENVTNRIDELLSLIKVPFKKIDEFIKSNEKESKKYEIYIFAKNLAISKGLQNQMDSLFRSPEFFDKRWTNASCSSAAWKREVTKKIEQASIDIETIQNMEGENVASLMAYYFQTLSIEKVKEFLQTLKKTSSSVAAISSGEDTQPIKPQNLSQDGDKGEDIQPLRPQTFIEDISKGEEQERNLGDSGVILCIANSLNPFTKEKISGIDERLKHRLLEIALKLKK